MGQAGKESRGQVVFVVANHFRYIYTWSNGKQLKSHLPEKN
jgi:hypothetical protein